MLKTFVTWNIYRGKKIDTVVQMLKKINADIVALQELSDETAKQIAKALGSHLHYCKATAAQRHGESYEIGNALMTKMPFKTVACHLLNTQREDSNTAETELRAACAGSIQIEDKEIRLICTHIYHPHHGGSELSTHEQIKNLLPLIDGSTILMGDLNNEGDSDALGPLMMKLKDARGESREPTFTNLKYNPDEKRIFDHIMVPPSIPIRTYTVELSDASDHLPVVASLEL